MPRKKTAANPSPPKLVLIPELSVDADEFVAELRRTLQHEPSDNDIRLAIIWAQAKHVLDRNDADQVLRYLVFSEYIHPTENLLYGKQCKRPWADGFTAFNDLVDYVIARERR